MNCHWCNHPLSGKRQKWCSRKCKHDAERAARRFATGMAEEPMAVMRAWDSACRTDSDVGSAGVAEGQTAQEGSGGG